MIGKGSIERLGNRHGKQVTVKVMSVPKVDYKSGNPAQSVIKQYIALNTICLDITNSFKELMMSFGRFQSGHMLNKNERLFLFQAPYKVDLQNIIVVDSKEYKVSNVEILDDRIGSIVRADYVSSSNN